jgi:serine/threonine-protein kinase RIO1
VFAAKVYKDRATRSFKNNSDYKEGRKVRNSRTQRAIDSGGRFGRDAAEQAWKSAEADALYKLVGSGVRVPEPVMFYEGVLLMDLVCDAEGRPAPRLIDVAIARDGAISILADLVAQMISMLRPHPRRSVAVQHPRGRRGPDDHRLPAGRVGRAQLARGVLLPARLRQHRGLPREL